MTTTIKATYRRGVLKPKKPLGLAEGTEVELTITTPAKEVDKDDPFADIIGICHSGRGDVAANHDQYLKRMRGR